MIFPETAVDEVAQCWTLAEEGKEEEAYQRLGELCISRPERSDIPLRLYWLLALNPALDRDRTRHDWLAAGLKSSSLSGPAAELYRRELTIDPDIALNGPYSALLSLPANHRDLLTVARWRLDAAGRSRSWDENRSWPAVQTDLETLAATIPSHNEGGWLGFLVATLDWAVWDRTQPVLSIARRTRPPPPSRALSSLCLRQGGGDRPYLIQMAHQGKPRSADRLGPVDPYRMGRLQHRHRRGHQSRDRLPYGRSREKPLSSGVLQPTSWRRSVEIVGQAVGRLPPDARPG